MVIYILLIYCIFFSFQVHIKFQNAEPLIEKFNQDLFERYELTLDETNTCNKINISRSSRQPPSLSKHNNNNNNNNISKRLSRSISSSSSSSSQFEPNPTTNSTNCNYFYYDTVNKGFVDINSLDNTISKPSQPNIMETQMIRFSLADQTCADDARRVRVTVIALGT